MFSNSAFDVLFHIIHITTTTITNSIYLIKYKRWVDFLSLCKMFPPFFVHEKQKKETNSYTKIVSLSNIL